MSLKNRFSIGRYTFIPTGKPTRIGPGSRRGLAAVEELGTSRTVKLIVGQTKGVLPHNRTGRCVRRPAKFNAAAVDAAFIELRKQQVDPRNVAATKVAGGGWYEGKGEKSVAYEIAYIPNGDEESFSKFKKNVNRLAEGLAERFCQDQVLILRDDGKSRSVAMATWKPGKRRRA